MQPQLPRLSSDQLHSRIVGYVLAITIITSVVITYGIARSLPYSIFAFHFNPYALIDVVSFLSNLAVLYVINRSKQRNPETLWFSLFIGASLVWLSCEFFQRLSITPEAAAFWLRLLSIGWIFGPVPMLIFSLVYVDREALLKRTLSFVFLFLVSFFFFLVAQTTDLLYVFDPARTVHLKQGFYDIVPGPYFPVYLVYILSIFGASNLIFYRYYQETRSHLRRAQLRIFMSGIMLMVCATAFFDTVLPMFGIVLPTVFGIFIAILCALLAYGILKYSLFNFSPVSLASSVLSNMAEGVVGVNLNKQVEFLNHTAQKLFGVTQSQSSGLTLFQVVGGSLYGTLKNQVFPTLQSQPTGTWEDLEITQPNRTNVPVSLTANQVTDENNSLKGYVLIFTNTSALKESYEQLQKTSEALRWEKQNVERKVAERTRELQREEAKLRSSIESLSLGFLMVNTHKQIIVHNKSLAAVIGWSGETFVSLQQALGSSLDLDYQLTEVFTHQKPVIIPEIVLNGKALRVVITPVSEGTHHLLGAVIILEDITEAAALNRSKDEFLAIASHELRTPLTAIRGNAATLQKIYGDPDRKDMTKDMVSDIYTSSIRLIELVNDFLTVSRLEQGKDTYIPEPLNVTEEIEKVVQTLRPLFQQKPAVHLEIKHARKNLPLVQAQSSKFQEIVSNLIDNALKYTSEGTITVSSHQENGQIVIRVADTGRGIPAENQPLLFHKFQQATSDYLQRDYTRSAGLGLYITRLLAERMGGTVTLESSTPGKGSVFALKLPLTPVKPS